MAGTFIAGPGRQRIGEQVALRAVVFLGQAWRMDAQKGDATSISEEGAKIGSANRGGIDLHEVQDQVSVMVRQKDQDHLSPPTLIRGLSKAAKKALAPPRQEEKKGISSWLSKVTRTAEKKDSPSSSTDPDAIGKLPSDPPAQVPQPEAPTAPRAEQSNQELPQSSPPPRSEKKRTDPPRHANSPVASQGTEPNAPDDALGTFTRRQTPVKRRKQNSYRAAPQDSKLGLGWWNHFWEGPAWIGRALWLAAFVCALIALSRCLDPSVSDPKLSQVPYFAFLGWLCCAGLSLYQRIPRRLRWTGLVLGAANSIALALSWSFRLDQL